MQSTLTIAEWPNRQANFSVDGLGIRGAKKAEEEQSGRDVPVLVYDSQSDQWITLAVDVFYVF